MQSWTPWLPKTRTPPGWCGCTSSGASPLKKPGRRSAWPAPPRTATGTTPGPGCAKPLADLAEVFRGTNRPDDAWKDRTPCMRRLAMAVDAKRVEEIFMAASEASVDGRAALLDRECAGDAELRQRVTAL